MKDKIVVKDEIFADFLIKNKDNHNISASPKVIMDRCIVEQVPETFSELRELCEELNNKIKDIQVSCVYEKHIVIQWYNDDNTDIDVYDDGTIFVENHLVAENRTPQQMWFIIKNLIGDK